jgi:hypothetical protein
MTEGAEVPLAETPPHQREQLHNLTSPALPVAKMRDTLSPEDIAATFEYYRNAATHAKNDVEVRCQASALHLDYLSKTATPLTIGNV